MKPLADYTYFLPRLPDDDSKPCLTQSLATCPIPRQLKHLTPRPLTSLTFFPPLLAPPPLFHEPKHLALPPTPRNQKP